MNIDEYAQHYLLHLSIDRLEEAKQLLIQLLQRSYEMGVNHDKEIFDKVILNAKYN